MLHLLTPAPAYYPERLREMLRTSFYKADGAGTYEVGPIRWQPNYGVFENLPFHAGDNPYYFETSAGLKDPEQRIVVGAPDTQFEPGFDRGAVLFTPAFTIFHKGTAAHLVYTSQPSEAELNAIDTFYEGHAYTVWLADLLAGEAVRILEIASR